MQNLQTINEFIEGLEAEEPNLKNCTQLASLYIVKKHLENMEMTDVEREIKDILPNYRIYADVKTKYAEHKVTEDAVVSSLHSLCGEIVDLVRLLYASTEMAKERKELGKLVESLHNMYENA